MEELIRLLEEAIYQAEVSQEGTYVSNTSLWFELEATKHELTRTLSRVKNALARSNR